MYNIPQFKEKDIQPVLQFIHEHPFAFMAGCSADGKPVATQIPVFIEERDGRLYLSGHIMRQTDHFKAFAQNSEVLCVFTGAHSYVSASWYNNPHQASTWNYMSVHVRGKLSFLDEAGLIRIMQKTTLHFEGNEASSPTIYDNLPEDYRSKLLKAIAGFEVEVTDMDHVFKLSQNRDHENYGRIINRLEEGDSDARGIADEMKKREEQLFGNRSEARKH